MLKSHHLIIAFFVSLILDGGTVPFPGHPGLDAGAASSPPISSGRDGGTTFGSTGTAGSIHWPDEVHPLATLDGSAILAAHAALQRVLARYPKESAKDCAHSAKAMEVIVGQEAGLYFVQINRRVEKCGWAAPGTKFDLDWFELYAVSPEGQVLERYPYHP
jgi:hypothetical protein